MSQRFALLALLALAAVAQPAAAACTYPRPPDKLPDGRTATLDELLAAQQRVRQFDADIVAYTECLQQEFDATKADPSVPPERIAELDAVREKKHNAAVDDAAALADRFNEQVRAFKARSKKE